VQKNKLSTPNTPNRSKNVNPNQQNRMNDSMNKNMQRGRKFNNRGPMNRPMGGMMLPQLSPMQNPGFYNSPPPMNYYQQPPMPAPQMQPAGPPRDMYYNNRPQNNGQYYGSNGLQSSSQPIYSGMNMQIPPAQQQPTNYYQQQSPYNNRGPMGGSINKMSPMPSQQVPPQQPMYQQYGNMNASPMGPGYQNYGGGYGNGQMGGMNNGVSNKYVGYNYPN
jgi:hypothetical protein